MSNDPHRDADVQQLGQPLATALGVVILLHGRGGTADDILALAKDLDHPQLAYLAPQAAENSWYPHTFLAPLALNEPWLTSALRKVDATLLMAHAAGIPADRVVIGGFSQGACVATEFTARHPQRYRALLAFTGGLIGPTEADLAHEGDLAGTPAYFSSGDPDPHVPWKRVQQSADILAGMGAVVTLRRHANRPRTISREELALAKTLIHQAFRP